MSASREKKQRQGQFTLGLTEKQKKQQQEEQTAQRKKIVYTAIAVISSILAVFLLVVNSGVLQRNAAAVTIHSEKYTSADVQFYYNSLLYNELANVSYGASTYDSARNARDQVYDEETGLTWREHFLEEAINKLTNVAAAYDKAKQSDFTLSEEAEKSMNDAIDNLNKAWIGTYASRDIYLRAQYGPYMTYERFLTLLERESVAVEYSKHINESLEYSDEDFDKYYQENPEKLEMYTLTQFSFMVRPELGEDESYEDLSEEELAARIEQAKEAILPVVEQVRQKLEDGEDPEQLASEYSEQVSSHFVGQDRSYSNVNSYPYGEWATDSARRAGDIDVSEYELTDTLSYYYLTRFDSRQLDESPTANVRHILIAAETDEGESTPNDEQYAAAEAEAQRLLDEWKAGEATEDSFAELAKEYSADTSSASKGGLMSNVNSSSGFIQEFTDWALDEARAPGDTGLVKNTGSSTMGYHIMYFVDEGNLMWQVGAENSLRSDAFTAWEETIAQDYQPVRGWALFFVK